MKILNLRLKNLNSLVGEWEIDFTDPAYQTDSIFAITGPTGAGKSTILDAICLALYGTTPRLGKITKSENELMSRQTGACFAEVTFSTASGNYRSYWSQHRSRKKAGEPLQQQKHELAEAESGKILEEKVSHVPAMVEQLTGMDFKRFTRSMLLAQGSFAAFLTASDDERSSILEQITGTAIYGELSRAAYLRFSEEKQKLKDLQQELSSVELLSDDAIAELNAQIKSLKAQYDETSRLHDKAKEQRQWLHKEKQLTRREEQIANQLQAWQQKNRAFSEQRERLSEGAQARQFEGLHARLTVHRESHAQYEKDLRECLEGLPDVKEKRRLRRSELDIALKQLQEKKDKVEQQLPLINKARALDSEIKSLRDQEAAALQRHSEQQEKIRQYKLREKRALNEKKESERLQQTLTTWLTQYQRDASLHNTRAGIESRLDNLAENHEQLALIESNQQEVAAELKKLQGLKLADKHEQELETARQRLQDAQQLLDARHQSLRLAAKVESLEAERNLLQEGEPCPLCGSVEHPYAEHSGPTTSSYEKEYEQAREAYLKAEQKLQQLKLEQVVSAKDLQWEQRRLEDKNNLLQKDKQQVEQRMRGLEERLSSELQHYQLKVPVLDDIAATKVTLKQRADSWQEHKDKHQYLSTVLGNIATKLTALTEQISEGLEILDEAQERLSNIERVRKSIEEQRRATLAAENVDHYEKQLRAEVSQCEVDYQQAQDHFYEINEKYQNHLNTIERLEQQLAESEPVLQKSEEEFAAAIADSDFVSEDLFLQALLSEEERIAIQHQAETLQQEQQQISFEQSELKRQFAEVAALQFDEKSEEELTAEIDGHQKRCEELQQQQGALQSQLDVNVARQATLSSKTELLQAQQTEFDHWYLLNELIGSADGKKYRNFAQGLTFEIMISHANQQLVKMTDRYLLVRDEQAPLQLNVIDDYQAGEVRSTRNLSGGESFIVSLALALGLSQMASHKVRVDSLFLDEGFGTLDEEALDVALDTLSSLQQDGKVIGVISHVPALKERIGNQLMIIPGTGGYSRIEGPGVQAH
ncbi:chromosome segregation protein SMC [Aliidiomarina minuta]|uniref:Chromosome segregation protein SMC n=1 Tax=Aliidiomarina minuta TaxID=880057 RepID=A0A432W173_9GAMM|nr:AAA family ATPase [Aliidiomarina minuta]RUO22979.1 chromosome segregation protein SMC [Aliidiomarina minuta]